jgi:hypothetical protein
MQLPTARAFPLVSDPEYQVDHAVADKRAPKSCMIDWEKPRADCQVEPVGYCMID